MKKNTLKKLSFSFLILSSLVVSGQNIKKKSSIQQFGKTIELPQQELTPSGHIRCATDEYEAFLQSRNPQRMNKEQFESYLAPFIESYNNRSINEVESESGGIIYIPVVVHVIHNGDAYGVDENITDEQIQSQITVMTQDYRKMLGTPGYNTNPIGADIQIEFVLAKSDPNGNPTNGINRINMCQDSWDMASINQTVKPSTIWDPTQYMNMWSVRFGGGDADTLGYAQFPSNNTDAATANTDGVVAGFSYFGSSALYPAGNFTAPYDRGRTMTHEVGHFLGLYHTFQGACAGNNGTSGDFCADTPAVAQPNFGCTAGTDSCPGGGLDMIQNYMDYTDDTCMNIFTNDQKSRIVAVMNSFPRRLSLRSSTKNIPIALFANDAEVKIENYCAGAGNACIGNRHQILLYNRGTANLTSATINYNVDGGSNSTYNWTGNLAPNKYEIITVFTPENSGSLNVSIASTNGTTDQRTGNNNTSKTFSFPTTTAPTDYPYTTFTFNLTGDPFGDETSWDIRNSSNSIVYSGGPYTFTGAAGTQVLVSDMTWTLPADCYTFTIYDSYGDGMGGSVSGGVSNNDPGSWTITTNNGATTVGSGGGDFGTFESVSFTNASLSNSNFNLDAISVYPNPTNNILNISIPSELGSNVSYEVFNYLGQNILKSNSENSNFSINTSNFANGVYILKLDTENGSKTLKFIKK